MSEIEYRHLRDCRSRQHENRNERCVPVTRAILESVVGCIVAGSILAAVCWTCCAASGYHWE